MDRKFCVLIDGIRDQSIQLAPFQKSIVTKSGKSFWVVCVSKQLGGPIPKIGKKGASCSRAGCSGMCRQCFYHAYRKVSNSRRERLPTCRAWPISVPFLLRNPDPRQKSLGAHKVGAVGACQDVCA